MTTLTVNIDNKKSEKAVKAVLDALGLNYSVEAAPANKQRPLNKAEQRLFNNLKKSFEEIKLHQEGKIELKSIEELLSELK
jgi:GTP cyclohydrolase I